MRASVIACLLGLSLASLRPLKAQPIESAADFSDQLSRERFRQAEIDFNLGKFEDALHGYQAAYEAKPLTAFLFNIAQCYRNLGNYDRARFFYKRYLTLEPKTPNRRVVNDLIAEVTLLQKNAAGGPAEPRPGETPAQPAASFTAIADPPAPTPPSSARGTPAAAPAPNAPAPNAPHVLALNAPAPAATRNRELALVARPAPPVEPGRPVYKRWWFWSGLAAVVAGGVVAAVLLTRPATQHGTLPAIDAR